jgi:hypothetical protein
MDLANLAARHDAQVRAVLDNGPFALIVLGGAHDLSDSVRRLGGGHCEYIRVTTRGISGVLGVKWQQRVLAATFKPSLKSFTHCQ